VTGSHHCHLYPDRSHPCLKDDLPVVLSSPPSAGLKPCNGLVHNESHVERTGHNTPSFYQRSHARSMYKNLGPSYNSTACRCGPGVGCKAIVDQQSPYWALLAARTIYCLPCVRLHSSPGNKGQGQGHGNKGQGHISLSCSHFCCVGAVERHQISTSSEKERLKFKGASTASSALSTKRPYSTLASNSSEFKGDVFFLCFFRG